MEAYIFRGKCVNVVDGDTIDVELDLGFKMKSKQRLRLFGVNTPELHHEDPAVRAKAQEAKIYMIKELAFQDIMVQTYKSDVFGRYLAKVYIMLDGTSDVYQCINDMLIAEGLAIPFKTDTDLLK